MNSSIKPPNASRKFQFDTDFEMEEENERLLALQQSEEGDGLLRISQEDLEKLQQNAFQQGLEQGAAEIKKSLDQALIDLSERTINHLRVLLDDEQARWNEAQRLSIATAMAALKRFWPQLVQQLGLETVEQIIRQSLELNNSEARIVVRVHDSLLDSVVKNLPQLKEDQAFAGKVIVLSDENVAVGDCKVEWADGGLERLGRNVSGQMDDALNRILAGIKDKTETQSNSSERMSS